MEDWLGYSPDDLLLFSQEVYRRLFMRANAMLAPLPLLTPLIALAALAAAFRRRRGPAALALVLAAGWAGVSAVFLPLYAEINWAVAGLAPAFWAQAAALCGAAALAPPGPLPRPRGAGDHAALAAMAAALLLWPALAPLQGNPWAAAEVFAMAPDPTALATLAALALLRRPLVTAILGLIPLLWLIASAATLLILGAPEGWAVLLAGPALYVLAVIPRGRALRSPPAA
ncbi:MAG: DUF6064 family protein [Pseudomonadota bacterium]